MKKKVCLLLVMVLLLVFQTAFAAAQGEKAALPQNTGFTPKAPTEYVAQLKDWRHSNQAATFIKNFNKTYPNVGVELTIVSSKMPEFTQKVLNACAAGVGAPDVFTAWTETVKMVADTGYWENLSAPPYNAEELVKNLVPYTVELGRDSEGNIRALTWQATIGGIYYRRSIAKQYFGTDDPVEIGKMFSTLDGFFNAGKILSEKSGGKIKLVSGYQSLLNMFLYNRKTPWVDKNGKFNMDPIVDKIFDYSYFLRQNDLDAGINQFTPAWFGTMQNTTVFTYFLPTWGLNYTLMPNAPDTSGDWAICSAPYPYIHGGTFAGIYSGSKNKEAAWEYLKFFIFNEEHLWDWGTNYGDYVSYIPVSKKIAQEVKTGKSVDFMGGQQVYEYFNSEINRVNADIVTKYDGQIRELIIAALDSYVYGHKTKAQSIDAFKKEIASAFPEIKM